MNAEKVPAAPRVVTLRSVLGRGSLRHPVDHRCSDRLALVVLEEVSAGRELLMGLTFRTGYPLDELVMQLAEHGVLRAPQREERTVEHLEPLPCLEVLVDAVVLGGDGHEGREDDGTDLVIGGGERCVVGGLLVIGEFSTRDRSTEQGADVVELGFLAVCQPEVEAGSDRFADRQARVADGDPSEPLGSPSACLLYTSPSPRDLSTSRMPSSA